jgi:hypothetical protein
MGEITRKVSLYNRAYFLAWQGLPDRTKARIPNIAQGLDKVIREQLRKGETDATKIAARAVNQVFGRWRIRFLRRRLGSFVQRVRAKPLVARVEFFGRRQNQNRRR